jgi:RimJ/RimL family protein N-acetyltransferase
MSWTLKTCGNASNFREIVLRYLMESEAIHNIQIGILNSLIEDPDRYDGDNSLAYVVSGDRIGGVAMRTPPHPGLLSLVEEEAVASRLTQHLLDRYPELERLNMPEATVKPALAVLKDRRIEYRAGMRTRLFQTSTVEPPDNVPGHSGVAEKGDGEKVGEWFMQFREEADEGSVEDEQRIRERGESLAGRGDVVLWETGGELVSMAAYVGRTEHGVRIAGVYTPPSHRENGYGSGVTAAATERALQRGRDYCFLFTDLDNATTNKIYPAIGYTAVGDWHNYELVR